MTNNHRDNQLVIFALIIVVGLGFALVLPWLANAQGMAAQNEVGVQSNAPTGTPYYVAVTGTGSGGMSWTDAFTNVQDALAVAAAGPAEIWVAKGVYYPDVGSGQIDNAVTSTFVMTDGVALIGGFNFGDLDISDQEPKNNVTVLSGDIDWDNGGADITDAYGVVITTTNIISDNAYHVVSAKGVTGTAVLDGFTITAGKANGSGFPNNAGGGFYCDGKYIGNVCSPSLKNLMFSGNLARYGGAVYNDGWLNGTSSPSLTNVTFSGNLAGDEGGAMYNDGWLNGTSSPSLTNVTFSGNSAKTGLGGAMYNYGEDGESSPILTNVTFSGNSSGKGGGAMVNHGKSGTSSPKLTNVVFSGNKAGNNGGAMFNNGSSSGKSKPVLTNVTFSGNQAGLDGGAMYNKGGTGIIVMDVRNCILWNNKDINGTGTISSTIYNLTATVSLSHSLVEGTGGSGSGIWPSSFIDGGGNIDEDPLFITPISPTTAPTTTGNLRLGSGSPAIDAGDDKYITVTFDLDEKPRKVDGDGDDNATVDMGAYEYNPKHLLTVNKTGTGDGTVTSTPEGIDCGDTCEVFYTQGSTVTLMAKSDEDSIFTGWGGACSDGGDCELTIDTSKSVTATFELGISNYLPLVKR